MQILQIVQDSSFDKFLQRVKSVKTEIEYKDFLNDVHTKEFSEIEIGIPALTGFTGGTINKYFSKQQESNLFLIELFFTNYTDDYNIDCFIVDEEPTNEIIKNIILNYQTIKVGDIF